MQTKKNLGKSIQKKQKAKLNKEKIEFARGVQSDMKRIYSYRCREEMPKETFIQKLLRWFR